jgi:hypothetical protein
MFIIIIIRRTQIILVIQSRSGRIARGAPPQIRNPPRRCVTTFLVEIYVAESWPWGTGASQLPSAVISTVDAPFRSPSVRFRVFWSQGRGADL